MIRYKVYVLLFLFLLLLIPNKRIQVFFDDDLPLLGKVIYIDPGHGGRDSGTSYGNTLEKDLNLQISNVLYNKLLEKGAIVYMTRTDDSDLSSKYDKRKKRGDLYRRIKKIENEKSDLYLSIHLNWYNNPYWGGAEVLYSSVNHENKIFGEILMKEFSKTLKTSRELRKTDLYMYNNIKTPGVLIECGFLSNARERNLLKSKQYQGKISNSILNAVVIYFKNKN